MKIQYNTDKNIKGDERHELHFSNLISSSLERFQSHISRIEVHLSDENGAKEGLQDKLCKLEARIEGQQPLLASSKGKTIEIAVSGAIAKLKTSLNSTIGRMQNKH